MSELSLASLQALVDEDIATSQFGEAMNRIKSFVEAVINDDESIAVVLASTELDVLCQKVASAYFGAARSATAEHEDTSRGTVVLVSEWAHAGGHVELIKDYVALGLFEQPVRIVLTDLFNRTEPGVVEEWTEKLACDMHMVGAAALDSKLDIVGKWIAEWRPSTIVSMGHNQDVVCIVAAHAPGPSRRYYIHHGDHHLSLGVTCPAFWHVDLHNMAFDTCRHHIGVHRQLYWPISAVRPTVRKSAFLQRGALTTASCGRMSKFEAGSYAIRYEVAVAKILKSTAGFHVHIGALSEDFLQRVYSALDEEGVERDRFRYVEWVASLSDALVAHQVDVYMPSFPLGGGKAQIEAMSVGLPIVLQESYRSPLLCGWGLANGEASIWRGYDDIPGVFADFDVAKLEALGAAALAHFEKHYSKDALMTAFDSGLDCAQHVPPIRRYHGNPLLRYLDQRGQREAKTPELRAELARITDEWKHVLAEYEIHSQTILDYRETIRTLSDERLLLIAAQERSWGLPGLGSVWKKKWKALFSGSRVN